MKRSLCLLVILITILGQACKDDPCLKKTGETVSDVRQLDSDSISILSITDNLDIEVYFSDHNYIEVVGGENLVNYVKHYDNQHVLELKNENNCQFLRDFDQELKVKVYLKSLLQVNYMGTGNLEFMNELKTRNFLFKAESAAGSVKLRLNTYKTHVNIDGGNMDISLFGISRHFTSYTSGASKVDASKFNNVYGGIFNDSSADFYVNITDSVEITINAVGDVVLFADPFIKSLDITGKGQVRKQ